MGIKISIIIAIEMFAHARISADSINKYDLFI